MTRVSVTFDTDKNAANIQKHGISLQQAEAFHFDSAVFRVDDSLDYGETRYRAIGWIAASLYILIFTPRGDAIRAISLRRATRQERNLYAKESD